MRSTVPSHPALTLALWLFGVVAVGLVAAGCGYPEILAAVGYRAWVVAGLVLFSILLAGAVTAYGYRLRQARLYRQLYQAEQERRRAHEGFRTTLYSIGDGVITTDTEGGVRRLNPVAQYLTGWSEAEAQGRPLAEVFRIVDEESRAEVDSPVQRVLREGVVVSLPARCLLLARDGTERPVADSGAPIRSEAGEVTGVVVTFRDQTRERQAAAEAERQKDLLATLVNRLPDYIYVKDSDSRFVLANQALADDLGCAGPEELVGRSDQDFFPPAMAAGFLADEQGILRTGLPLINREEMAQTAAGRAKRILTTKVPLRDRSGAVTGLVGIGRDVTRLRQEEQRQLALHRLRDEVLRMQSAEEWTRVAGLVGRELRGLIAFGDCGVNLIDRPQRSVVAYIVDAQGMHRRGAFTAAPAQEQAMDTGRPVYRRNLADLQRLDRGMSDGKRSIVDVPFRGGTLAINSTHEDAFSAWDIQTLEQFAQVLSEAHRRLEDLQAGEAHRRQREQRLKLDLALQRVRTQVLQMQSEADWLDITRSVRAELRPLVEFDDCSVCLVDRADGATVFYAASARDGWVAKRSPRTFAAVERALETGEPVYRRTRAEMEALQDAVLEPEVCSVVDVPFTQGTLAVNSAREEAFTPHDIDVLQQFAQVLSQARQRSADLEQLASKEAQFRQAQKMEAVGRLAGGVAHDFNNLLTIINGSCQLLLRRLPADDSRRGDVEGIYHAGERAAALVRQLQAFSRQQTWRPEVLNLNRLITDLGKMLGRLIGEDIEVNLRLSPHLAPVRADPVQLEQALMNLVVNARDAMPTGGRLTVETANAELERGQFAAPGLEVEPGAYVLVAVSDTGTGMDAQTQARLFEPFFTTKEPGKGTGLGLAMVYGIVQQNQGYIQVSSEPGRGSTFSLYLPQAAPAAETPAPFEAAAGDSRGDETVLVVEDDQHVRELVARVLQSCGYTVLEGQDGAEALQVLSRCQGTVHLLVTDVVMPGMTGIELAERVRRSRPQIRILYMSGYSEHAALSPDVRSMPLIQKPFAPDALTRQVRRALDEGPR
ncbi:MAG: PAS domain-containing protein [Candidatus Latescibacterota bacterium]